MEKKNLFKNRNFALTFLGELVSNIANMFASFACGFYILDLSSNNATIQGLYLAVSGIVFCIVVIFGGVISDRFNKAKIMFLCDYAKCIVIGLMALAFLFIKDNNALIIVLFVSAILSQVIAGIFSPAAGALIPEIVEDDQLQTANSYHQILTSFQSIVGAILAAILYAILPAWVLFVLVAALYMLSGISEMFIKINFVKKDEKLTVKNVFLDLKDGIKYISSQKAMFALLCIIIFINFFFSPIADNFIAFFAKTTLVENEYIFKNFLTPEMWVSACGIAVGIGSIIFGIIMSAKDQVSSCHKTTRVGLLLLSILLIIYAIGYWIFVDLDKSLSVFVISSLVMMLGVGMVIVYINVPSSTVIQKIVKKEMLGKVNAVASCASQGLIPLATFLGGLALTYFGSMWLIVICTLGFVITTLFCIFNKNVSEI